MQNAEKHALEAMSRFLEPEIWDIIDKYPEEILAIRQKNHSMEKAKKIVDIYFSAREVLVETEEEANLLPAGTVLELLNEQYPDYPIAVRQKDGNWYGAWDWEIQLPIAECLPARIIARKPSI